MGSWRPCAKTRKPLESPDRLSCSQKGKTKMKSNFTNKRLLFPAALIFSSTLLAPAANAQDPMCPYTQASIQGTWGVVGTYGANIAKAFGHRTVDASGVMTGDFVLNAPKTDSTTGERTISTGLQAGTYIIKCDGTGVINRTTTSSLGIVVVTVDNFAVTNAIVQDGKLIATELVDAQQIPSGLVPGGVFLTRVHTRLPDVPPAPSSNTQSSPKPNK